MKLIVCDSCEAVYKIKHDLDETYYVMKYCIFCGEPLSEELEESYLDGVKKGFFKTWRKMSAKGYV